jgi:hypothetical protein
MRSIQAAPVAMALLLTACGGDPTPPEDNKRTDTKMEAVDVIDGTISDDMVDLDTADSADANLTDDAADQSNTDTNTDTDTDADSGDAAEAPEETEAAAE